jgi:hypothetical protein
MERVGRWRVWIIPDQNLLGEYPVVIQARVEIVSVLFLKSGVEYETPVHVLTVFLRSSEACKERIGRN